MKRIYQNQLRELEKKEAAMGVYTPAYILTEINRIKNEINKIDSELFGQRSNKSSADSQNHIVKILFLAANPSDTTRLELDEEIRAIDEALRKSNLREHFELIQHHAVRVSDFPELLLRHKPDIVHFSGHGSASNEIIMKDDFGNSNSISRQDLGQLFAVLKDKIRCVVLNACFTQAQAKVIAQHIDCVIGMAEAIQDKAAISFAAAFYQALGYGRNLNTAFELGLIQLKLKDLDDQNKPQLIAIRSDPSSVVLINDV